MFEGKLNNEDHMKYKDNFLTVNRIPICNLALEDSSEESSENCSILSPTVNFVLRESPFGKGLVQAVIAIILILLFSFYKFNVYSFYIILFSFFLAIITFSPITVLKNTSFLFFVIIFSKYFTLNSISSSVCDDNLLISYSYIDLIN